MALPAITVTAVNRGAANPVPGSATMAWGFALVVLLAVCALCGATVWIGLPHNTVYGHDVFITLDGAWRIGNGQRPHVDFFSSLGALVSLLPLLGMRLAGGHVQGLVLSTALTGVALGAWALLIVRERYRPAFGALAVASLVAFWLAPFPIGEPFFQTGYAMQYNRLGYVLLAIVLLELFAAPPEGATRANQALGGFSSGAAAALLLFIKFTFFAAALPAFLLAYVIRTRNARHSLAALCGFVSICIPVLAWLRWDAMAVLHDYAVTSAARTLRLGESHDPWRTLVFNFPQLATYCGFVVLAWFHPRDRAPFRFSLQAPVVRIAAIALCMLSADVLLAISNTQREGLPLVFTGSVILAGWIYKAERKATATLFFLCLAVVLPSISPTLNAWALVWRIGHREPSAQVIDARVDGPLVHSLVFNDRTDPAFADYSRNNGAVYINGVNEALQLIRAHSSQTERVFCLCFSNPFSYALMRQPPLGGSTFLDYGTNFSPHGAPSAARLFGDAELVLHPKPETAPSGESAVIQFYRQDLSASYSPLAESPHWTLLRRNTRTGSGDLKP